MWSRSVDGPINVGSFKYNHVDDPVIDYCCAFLLCLCVFTLAISYWVLFEMCHFHSSIILNTHSPFLFTTSPFDLLLLLCFFIHLIYYFPIFATKSLRNNISSFSFLHVRLSIFHPVLLFHVLFISWFYFYRHPSTHLSHLLPLYFLPVPFLSILCYYPISAFSVFSFREPIFPC